MVKGCRLAPSSNETSTSTSPPVTNQDFVDSVEMLTSESVVSAANIPEVPTGSSEEQDITNTLSRDKIDDLVWLGFDLIWLGFDLI
jgi:hypothetical protein